MLAYKGQTIFDQNTQADLYGPFWIPATVSLTLFVVSNVAGFMTIAIVYSFKLVNVDQRNSDHTIIASCSG